MKTLYRMICFLLFLKNFNFDIFNYFFNINVLAAKNSLSSSFDLDGYTLRVVRLALR